MITKRTSISTPRKIKPKKSAEYSLGESRPIKGMYAMVLWSRQCSRASVEVMKKRAEGSRCPRWGLASS